MSVCSDKIAFRADIKNKMLTFRRRPENDAAIVRHISACAEFAAAKTVALFSPICGEPDISALFGIAAAMGKTICFPVCDVSKVDLRFYVVKNPSADFARGHYGVMEPKQTVEMPIEQIDFMLVPGLAFDRTGARLGRGKGYYDRTLAGKKAVKCGVAYSLFVYPLLPTEKFDEKMDIVITERGVKYFAEKGEN